ncbi:MAG: TIGR03663 family protein, partial [Thermomicrobiales bacterium]|nr:TIGR03663 family protein [Thermomicrobiales bacterium]
SSVGWRLSYADPDVPTEMLIYTQTSPDITRVVDELTALSFELTGGYDLEIWYDSGVSWPMQWYLRDFPNKHFYGSQIAGPPGDAPVLLVASDRNSSVEPHMAGYTAQEYVLRWWFPEELYRDFAIAPELDPGRSAWSSPDDPHGVTDVIASMADSVEGALTPDGQARLFRMLLFRDLEQPLGHYRFRVYIRNDLLPLLNSIRY